MEHHTPNGERQAILVNLPIKQHAQLKELAGKEHRSMAAQAGMAIEQHLERELAEAEHEAAGAKS